MYHRRRLTLAAGVVTLLSLAAFSPRQIPQVGLECDTLFTGGQVLDGTGNPSYPADVAVTGDRITAVLHPGTQVRAKRVIDISGRIIGPGFIDIHTHSYDDVTRADVWEGEDARRYDAPNFISQGVTTVVSNECGYGTTDIGLQREILTDKGTGPNVILLIGHNSVRREVMGSDHERAATQVEITRMRALVHQAMLDGAFGMSSGLEYVPAIWSTTDELVALMDEISPFGGFFQAHERASGYSPMWYVPSQDEPDPPSMIDNVLELIEVGERTGGRIIITHIKARGYDFWGGSGSIINLISDARNRGVDVWADAYPYTSSGSDGSTVLIPRWATGRDPQTTLGEVLADEERKADLILDIKHNLNWRGGAMNVIVMDYPDSSYIGRSVGELARERGLTDVEMVITLQMEGNPRRAGGARLRGFSMSEIDIEAFYAQPWTATGSDANIALPSDGPVHARFYGTFPRKIRHYALDQGVISVEDAVRTSTSLPAQILGLRDRGQIREGFRADIVVFDLKTIRDTATFFEPHQYAEGIDYVMVNGQFALEKSELTWKRAGRVLTRPD
ncbi:amidohydrolase family protein [Gemmatimonadota bacterium]